MFKTKKIKTKRDCGTVVVEDQLLEEEEADWRSLEGGKLEENFQNTRK